jgi:hypothetical protein
MSHGGSNSKKKKPRKLDFDWHSRRLLTAVKQEGKLTVRFSYYKYLLALKLGNFVSHTGGLQFTPERSNQASSRRFSVSPRHRQKTGAVAWNIGN